MSKWTDFRDTLEEDIKSMTISEQAKQDLTKSLVDNIMPAVEAWVDKLADGLAEEAKSESGWCKIRDGAVLPYALKVLVYIGKQVLTKTMENTVTAATA